jgi:hypothetical protein
LSLCKPEVKDGSHTERSGAGASQLQEVPTVNIEPNPPLGGISGFFLFAHVPISINCWKQAKWDEWLSVSYVSYMRIVLPR